ncbi:DUF6343 family protein [Streptomyces litchfieldiae]|uniref:DUF6343 family protein n=1 Tax=Streptomyces litchfieldiae TaxID=3075543 RepID=A0ABU2MZW8_9ACTN|nr:DUF6343 family protein [Streptomyces sp. DSM 44938]MDT0346604.1 DUF6343 family protein [Streptomyces sp. DSM 44938]
MGRGRHARTGTEPITAYSALRLRLLLSGIFLPFFLIVAVLLAVWWTGSDANDSPSSGELAALTLACAVLALIAAIDILVVLRRRRSGRGSGQQP